MQDESDTTKKNNFTKVCKMLVHNCRGVMFEIVQRSIEPPLQKFDTDSLEKIKQDDEKSYDVLKAVLDDITKPPVETDFDISSLYILLRYWCEISDPPTQGWGENVDDDHMKISDDIERIQMFRDMVLIQFGQSAKIPLGEYNPLRDKIKQVLKRLEDSYGGIKYQSTIDRVDANEIDKNTHIIKDTKSILKDFLKSCETAVDMGDPRLKKQHLEAKGTMIAAGTDTEEIIRQQEIVLEQLRHLVEELKIQINAAAAKIESQENEIKLLKEENEQLKAKEMN